MREGTVDNNLIDRLAGDPRLGLTREQVGALIAEPLDFTGAARSQVARVAERVQAVAQAHPQAAAYSPAPIL